MTPPDPRGPAGAVASWRPGARHGLGRQAAAAAFACSFAAIATAGIGACADPVHDTLVQSLGAEDSQVPPGPSHRPGQPCLTCHGGSGPASRQFSLGGTVYAVLNLPRPATGAVVQIEDVDGRFFTATTNAAGNFFVLPGDFTPHYPIHMKVRSANGNTMQQMQSLAARDGSCAGCHVDPPSPTSPGRIYLSANDTDGGSK